MACHFPLNAWRGPGGDISFRLLPHYDGTEEYLRLPCGSCLGCRMAKAREWAIRCQLELSQHDEFCWTTLTYDDSQLPDFGSLEKSHVSSWLKRLRARHPDKTIRFFACGEYGETTHRAHYHSVLFGLADDPSIQDTWPHGYVRVDPLTPAAISYVAGYCNKKLGWKHEYQKLVDPETGELLYERQPPFILMSRRPGIGGFARKHWRSWRDSAIWHGREVPVPRFLHKSWQENASEEAIAQKKQDDLTCIMRNQRTRDELQQAATVALAKHHNQAQKRRKL